MDFCFHHVDAKKSGHRQVSYIDRELIPHQVVVGDDLTKLEAEAAFRFVTQIIGNDSEKIIVRVARGGDLLPDMSDEESEQLHRDYKDLIDVSVAPKAVVLEFMSHMPPGSKFSAGEVELYTLGNSSETMSIVCKLNVSVQASAPLSIKPAGWH